MPGSRVHHPGQRLRQRSLIAALATLLLLANASLASAAWSDSNAGAGRAKATSMQTPVPPGASVSGVLFDTVTVTWPAAAYANGAMVGSYTVRRYNALTGTAATVLAASAGTISATSCVESSVPPGSWKYTVTAAAGAWRSAESLQTTAVTTL